MMLAAVAAMFAASSASGANAYWYGEGGTGVGAKGANAWSTAVLDTAVEGWADALATWAGSGNMYVPLADNTINLAGGLTVTTVLNPDTAAKNILFTNGTLSVSQNYGWPGSSQQCDNMSFTFGKGAALYLTGSAPRMKLEDGVTMVFTDGATYSEKNGKNDSYYNLIGCEGATSNALVVANGATVTMKSQLRIGAPVLLCIASNDALGASAENIGKLLNRKNIYFVPVRQDDPDNKPNSLVARFELLPECVGLALDKKQYQPIFS